MTVQLNKRIEEVSFIARNHNCLVLAGISDNKGTVKNVFFLVRIFVLFCSFSNGRFNDILQS